MFSFLVEILERNGKGINAYRQCIKAAQEAIIRDESVAAPLFLLSSAAEDFIQLYERMPLQSAVLNDAFDQFVEDLTELQTSFSEGESDTMLSALNSVALRMAKHRQPETAP
jgi:hypothetical protein